VSDTTEADGRKTAKYKINEVRLYLSSGCSFVWLRRLPAPNVRQHSFFLAFERGLFA